MEIVRPNPESQAQSETLTEIDKAVFVMFPDIYTTGPCMLDENGEIISGIGQRYKDITTSTLKYYKKHGWKAYSVVFTDTDDDSFTPFYPIEMFDGHYSVPASKKEFGRTSQREDFESVLNNFKFKPDARVRVGGYHFPDCVAGMIRLLRERGVNAHSSLPLTNESGDFLTMSRISRKMMGRISSEDTFIYQDFAQRMEQEISRGWR